MSIPPLDAWTAGLVAALIAFALRGVALHRAAADREALGDDGLLALMSTAGGPWQRTFAAMLLAAGVGLLAAAAVAGGFGGRQDREDADSFETVIVLDASNSMLAEDVRPSRLRLEQSLARRMVSRLAGRIGVVYFAGSGYVLSPLTEDRAATLMFTEAVHPTHVGRGGTSMVDGLEQALVVLAGGRPGAVRSIVLLSDGESTVDDPGLALVLERARRAGVSIHAVGIGTAEGGRIPMPREADGLPGLGGDDPRFAAPDAPEGADSADGGPDAERRWLRDQAGRVVVTRLDEPALREIARATGGLYAAGAPAADALLGRMPAGGAAPPVSTAAVNGLLLAAFLALAVEAYLVRRT